MKHYVLGFFFDSSDGTVLLICKNSPEWQKGLFNGLGGVVESGEFALEAMIREFHEESGLTTKEENWQYVMTLHNTHSVGNEGCQWVLDVFRGDGDTNGFKPMCDEGAIAAFSPPHLPTNMEQSARWLLLMCADNSMAGATGKFAWRPVNER